MIDKTKSKRNEKEKGKSGKYVLSILEYFIISLSTLLYWVTRQLKIYFVLLY